MALQRRLKLFILRLDWLVYFLYIISMREKITALMAKDEDKGIKCLCDECECNGCYDCGECTGYSAK